MAEKQTARGHRRTRRDHASETAEDYVEAIAAIVEASGTCRVKDLAERFGVTHVTVIRNTKRLVREGLVVTEPYQPLGLTKAGHELAARCQERHRTVYAFLLSLGVSPSVAAIDAEGIEHHVSDETLARLREKLNDSPSAE